MMRSSQVYLISDYTFFFLDSQREKLLPAPTSISRRCLLVCLSIEPFNITLKSHQQDFILLHPKFLVSLFVSTSHFIFIRPMKNVWKGRKEKLQRIGSIGFRCLLRTNTQTVNFHEYIYLLLSSPSSSKRKEGKKKKRIERQSFASKQYRKSNGVNTRNEKRRDKTMHSLFGLSLVFMMCSPLKNRKEFSIIFLSSCMLLFSYTITSRDEIMMRIWASRPAFSVVS